MRTQNKISVISGIVIFLLLIKKKVNAANFIIKHEGLRLNAYQDTGSVWTVGYGSTFNYAQNRPVQRGDKITKETAVQWLEKDTSKAQEAVKLLVKVPINRNQFIALTSLAYNIGIGAFRRSSLLKLLNAKEPKIKVADQFLRWRFDNGKEIEGLLNRRKDERALFLS